MIDDGNQIAQLLRFVHVVGGEHHRLALGLDRLYSLPEVVARLGIQSCGGLIQKQQFGIPEQGQSQQQALTLAPESLRLSLSMNSPKAHRSMSSSRGKGLG